MLISTASPLVVRGLVEHIAAQRVTAFGNAHRSLAFGLPVADRRIGILVRPHAKLGKSAARGALLRPVLRLAAVQAAEAVRAVRPAASVPRAEAVARQRPAWRPRPVCTRRAATRRPAAEPAACSRAAQWLAAPAAASPAGCHAVVLITIIVVIAVAAAINAGDRNRGAGGGAAMRGCLDVDPMSTDRE